MSTEKPSSPAAIQKQTDTGDLQAGLDDLPDELLLEVLARVPAIFPTKEAARLRAVSQRWNSIIKAPDYIPRFLSLGGEGGNGEEVLLLSDIREDSALIYTASSQSDPNVLEQPVLDFGYISDDYVVTAASEDLLLLSPCPWWKGPLVVCNPFTNSWAALPYQPNKDTNFVFVCEPQGQGGRGHRYRVLSTKRENVFVSETGQWKEVLFTMDQFKSNIVPLSGKLYWYSSSDGRRHIVSYDPFEESFSYFPHPDPNPLEDDTVVYARCYWSLHVVRGSLRMLKFSSGPRIGGEEFYDLISWELDFKHERWSLIYKSSSRSYSYDSPEHGIQYLSNPIALHPDGHVVYFSEHQGLVSCDLCNNNVSKVAVKDEPEHTLYNAFLLTRPRRPTSVCYGSSRLMKPPGGEEDTFEMGERWRLGGKKGKAEGEFHRVCLHEETGVASTTSRGGGSFEHEQIVSQLLMTPKSIPSQRPDDAIQPPPDIPVSLSICRGGSMVSQRPDDAIQPPPDVPVSLSICRGGSMVSQHPDAIQPPPDVPVSTSNQLFKPPGSKPALMVGVGLQILQQLSGINGVSVLLSNNLGLGSDSVSLSISVLTMLLMLLCITVSMRLMDVAGRRLLMLSTIPILVVSLIALIFNTVLYI